MNKIDDYILYKIQDAYLWILDWTGLYLATVAATVFILGKAAVGFNPLSPLDDIIVLGNLGILVPRYLWQDKGLIEKFNLHSLALQKMSLRTFFTYFVLGSLLASIVKCEWSNAFLYTTYLIFMQLTMVCIRDREPKEFRQPKLATENS